jgi:AraC family transcriptional regulator of adaptative response / DNA-3-methyladenine glycosylase II
MDTALALDTAACDRARLARDARFDGVFFTAVRSTGIYCRPVCPAPPPKPRNITYYPTAAAAAAAGSPVPALPPGAGTAGPAGTGRADRAARPGPDPRRLPAGAAGGRSRAKLGLSARQLQRLFVEHLGATPGQIHATHRLLLAKQLLTETTLPVTDVALAAGYNSLRRFNTAFLQGCGMAPTALRRQHQPLAADDGGLVLRLGYRPPLDFPRMLAFLRKRSLPGIELIGEDSYQRVLGTPERPTLLRVTADPKRPELRLQLGAVDPRLIPDIVRRVRRVFDLDADLQQVHAALGEEPLLARGIAERPGCACPAAGMASRWACAPCSASRSASPPPPPSRGGWWMPMARTCRACRPSSIASSRRPRCWPRRRWNRSACRAAAPPPCVRWPPPAPAASSTSARPGAGRVCCPLRGTARHRPVDRAVHRPARPRPARCLPGRRPGAAAGARPRAGPAPERTRNRSALATVAPWRAYAVLHLWHLSGTFVGEPT